MVVTAPIVINSNGNRFHYSIKWWSRNQISELSNAWYSIWSNKWHIREEFFFAYLDCCWNVCYVVFSVNICWLPSNHSKTNRNEPVVDFYNSTILWNVPTISNRNTPMKQQNKTKTIQPNSFSFLLIHCPDIWKMNPLQSFLIRL